MIFDHDAVVGLTDFDCEDDPLRFDREICVV